jgi:hypothetical protein
MFDRLAAVIVALYRAWRGSRLDIRAFLVQARLFSPGVDLSHLPEFLQIRIVNHGREATVVGIEWSLRGPKRQSWRMFTANDELSTQLRIKLAQLPIKLGFGDEALFFFPTTTFNADARSLLQRIQKSAFPRLTVRLLRVAVFASTGQQFHVPLDRDLRHFILERSIDAAVTLAS